MRPHAEYAPSPVISNHFAPATVQGSIENVGDSRRATSMQPTDRPTTAPAFHDTQGLNEVLPPKGQLPFSQPGPRASYTSADRRQTSFFFKPTDVGDFPVSAAPDMNMGAAVTAPQPHSPAHFNTAGSGSPASREFEWALSSHARPPSTSSPLQPPPFHTSSPNVSSNGSQATTHKGPEFEAPPPPAAQPSVPTISTPVSSGPPIQEPMNITSHSPHTQQTRIITSADLKAYMEKPDSERSEMINTWICQQLEDDGFRVLCQDMERVWRRIAFGSGSTT
ncbi:hypothetical protein VTN31DRAFT_2451 [Thermomyces dupontii]|uniref:uncharacterized protein n=1 Tax=Talaromyces thermophilus TaxID=28565 RepID=UPI003743FE0A